MILFPIFQAVSSLDLEVKHLERQTQDLAGHRVSLQQRYHTARVNLNEAALTLNTLLGERDQVNYKTFAKKLKTYISDDYETWDADFSSKLKISNLLSSPRHFSF